jgi:ATP-binding cassette subfamily B protein
MRFPLLKQQSEKDCGPTCLRMICEFHGKIYRIRFANIKYQIDSNGMSLKNMALAAESIGLIAIPAKIDIYTLERSVLPLIVHWKGSHFVVVHKANHKYIWIADPAKGGKKYKKNAFINYWINSNQDKTHVYGTALILKPIKSPRFSK